MASHLVIADWLGSHAGSAPKLIDQGYPVGPHALVDGVCGGFSNNDSAGFYIFQLGLWIRLGNGFFRSRR